MSAEATYGNLSAAPPVRRNGAPWNLPMPTTTEEIIQLWIDVPEFLVWSAIRNNFSGVLDNMRQAGMKASDTMSARTLYELVLLMDQEEKADVLNVAWRNGRDPEQDRAYGLLRDRVLQGTQTGTEKFVLPLLAGLFSVGSAVIQGQNAEEQRDTAERLARMEAQAAAQAKAERAAKWERVKKWLIPAAIVAAVIAVLIIIRIRR